ncbi:hypothetical protein C380_10810 [Acidovorax sp. KKS102]|uniref:hypothetical protein n=1 Tax=Acidovorax sp. KKS102 TaxID=358220 RepID=UPI00028B2DDD|nr:hypothetical protein [Acidovorax sp. KKS102]AFU45863.1 hypothetical protein C380_10810 [Acidovorax sp. KKS102]
MTRAPSYLDDNTRTFARTCPGFGKTAAQQAIAIEVYRTPLYKRLLWAFCRRGWLIVPAVIAGLVLSGCTSDIDDAIAVHADLADAIAQAGKGEAP